MAPKRAFGGGLRPFGGGFRGPNRERASVFSGAGRGRNGGRTGQDRAGQGRTGEDGRGQRCSRGGPEGAAVEPGAEPACSAVRDGRAGGGCGERRGTKKRTSVRPLLLYYSATLRASAPGCSSDAPSRTTTVPHSGSPSLLRETIGRRFGSMSSCNSLSALDFGLPVGRGHSRESLSHPEPQPLSRPPVGVTAVKASAIGASASARHPGLSRLAAGISAVRDAPVKASAHHPGLTPSAAGVTAPPRRYGRPPAAGESPASSSRRASPARDSTAYRPAP